MNLYFKHETELLIPHCLHPSTSIDQSQLLTLASLPPSQSPMICFNLDVLNLLQLRQGGIANVDVSAETPVG